MPDATRLREYVKLRRVRDQAKAAYEEADQEYQEMQKALYAEMEDSGEKTIRIDLGPDGEFTFTRRQTVYGRVIDKEALAASLKENGLDHILTTDFQKARLNELAREILEQGSEGGFPEGMDFRTADVVAISRKA